MKVISSIINTQNILVLTLVMFFTIAANSQDFSNLSYSASNEDFRNPERGFIKFTSTYSANYGLLTKPQLERYLNDDNASMLWRILYLKDFVDAPISVEYLNDLQTDLDLIREVGMKCIIRFAYTDAFTNGFGNPPYNDATPARTLQHIEQLKPILMQNSDVIAVMNAGFFGTWGEWHFTDHYTTSGNLEEPNDADWINRKELIEALLDALPTDRMVQVRFPIAKYKIAESEIPLTEAEAYNGSFKSRIAHHNDCFLASSSDFGTYKIDIPAEKLFLENDSKYLAVGGEACAPSWRTECTISLEEVERFHWDYMNSDYNTAVHNQWKSEGCYDEISRRLGYRFRLITAEIQNEVQPGNTFGIEIKLTNDGFSSPFNPRDMEVVLRHELNGATYKVQVTNVNPQKWYAGDEQTINFEAGISGTMPHGNYEVFVNLLDPRATLQTNPNYAIRLANPNSWESTTGFNHLHHKVTINGSAAGSTYVGTDIFSEFIPASTSSLLAPTGFDATVSGSEPTSQIDITWSNMDGETGYTLKRSEDGTHFTEVANLPADQTSYTDEGLKNQSTYHYKLYAFDDDGISPATAAQNATTGEGEITGIKKHVDNNISIYPNPFDGILNIDIHTNKAEYIEIKLYDINGRYLDHIYEGILSSEEVNRVTWSKTIKKGFYLIKIEYPSSNVRETLKLMVN